MRGYLLHHEIHVSALTVMERVRGYSLLWRRATDSKRESIEAARVAYLRNLGRVVPLEAAIAVVAGEIIATLTVPPSPPRRSHQLMHGIPAGAIGSLAIRRNDRRNRARR